MEETPQHTYQVLTKRAERLEELSKKLSWPANVWMGVSVESTDYQFRMDHLRRTKAKTKFLSLEPLLGPLDDLDLRGIDWAIAGGESGPGARPMQGMGPLDTRSVRRGRSCVPLQTVGRKEQEENGPHARRPHMGRVAEFKTATAYEAGRGRDRYSVNFRSSSRYKTCSGTVSALSTRSRGWQISITQNDAA